MDKSTMNAASPGSLPADVVEGAGPQGTEAGAVESTTTAVLPGLPPADVEGGAPQGAEEPKKEKEPTFISLEALLDRVEVGVLATAIEKGGVQGWDRYGRFGAFDAESAEARAALDLLSEWHLGAQERLLAPRDPMFEDSADCFISEYARYGWPDNCLPDFKSIGTAMVKMRSTPESAQAKAKGEKANLGIIDGLLLVVEGELGTSAHTAYESEAKLIQHLQEKMAGYPGNSKRNLEAKFAAAKRLMNKE